MQKQLYSFTGQLHTRNAQQGCGCHISVRWSAIRGINYRTKE